MKRAIYKFRLNQDSFTTNRRILKFLTVQEQYGEPVVWAEVDLEDEVNITYRVLGIGTGWVYTEDLGEYIGTWQNKYDLVYHYFVKEKEEKKEKEESVYCYGVAYDDGTYEISRTLKEDWSSLPFWEESGVTK